MPEPTRDPFPMMSLDDAEPSTRTDLFFFWAFILGAAAVWVGGLIRVGYWIATFPAPTQTLADYLTGMLLGIGIGILIVAGLYRPVSRADRDRDAAKRTPE